MYKRPRPSAKVSPTPGIVDLLSEIGHLDTIEDSVEARRAHIRAVIKPAIQKAGKEISLRLRRPDHIDQNTLNLFATGDTSTPEYVKRVLRKIALDDQEAVDLHHRYYNLLAFGLVTTRQRKRLGYKSYSPL